MENSRATTKQLYRSEKGKIIAGVCSGLAEHFDVDPILVRLIFLLLSLINGLGIIIYAVLWFILPRGIKVTSSPESELVKESIQEEEVAEVSEENLTNEPEIESQEIIILDKRSQFFIYSILGLLPIVVGAIFLLEKLVIFPGIWLIGRLLWPVILVVLGFIVIVAGATRK